MIIGNYLIKKLSRAEINTAIANLEFRTRILEMSVDRLQDVVHLLLEHLNLEIGELPATKEKLILKQKDVSRENSKSS